jgi:hypothetical protein
MFLIFVRILRISLFFLDYPPRILDGITWRLQKEPPISNSKITYSLLFINLHAYLIDDLFFPMMCFTFPR